jgi:PPOX class probable F420-dependent enzyme
MDRDSGAPHVGELDEAGIRLLNGRHVAALATLRDDGLIHVTAVWYLYEDGLLFVATGSGTRQVRNVDKRPTASLMVDTRVPGFERGLTASGTADTIRGEEAQPLRRRIQARYLTERAFSDLRVGASFEAHDDVVIRLTPRTWVSWDMAQLNAQFFGGRLGTHTGYMYPLDDA